MQQSSEESPSSDHNSATPDREAEIRFYPDNAPFFDADFRDTALFNVKPGSALKDGLQTKLIRFLITLHPGRPHTRPFSSIEKSELQACGVGVDSHRATQRIDLPYDVSFCQAADGGIA
jgi:hypothetical protein